MINLIKELKTQIELLRESLTNQKTKLLIEPDSKNPKLQANKTEDHHHQKKCNSNNKLQPSKLSLPNLTTIPSKKSDNNESQLPTPKETSWKRKSSKHKSRISLIETKQICIYRNRDPGNPLKTKILNIQKAP